MKFAKLFLSLIVARQIVFASESVLEKVEEHFGVSQVAETLGLFLYLINPIKSSFEFEDFSKTFQLECF